MAKEEGNKKLRKTIEVGVILFLCVITLALDFIDITYVKDAFYNRMLSKIIQQSCGIFVAVWFMFRFRIRLFGKVCNWLYLIPCLIVALDNFQFSAYFNGQMQLTRTEPLDFIVFALYCLSIGFFEELVFRGIIFSVLAGTFSKDKKGFLKTYVVSSVIFGVSHIFNGFNGAALLQVGYTVLTGGLFAFCLIKTKNIVCCAFVHGLYNFCGLLFDPQGLGEGVVFDLGTVLTMLIVSVVIGVFVLYKTWKYTDEERIDLYARLGVETPTEDAVKK